MTMDDLKSIPKRHASKMIQLAAISELSSWETHYDWTIHACGYCDGEPTDADGRPDLFVHNPDCTHLWAKALLADPAEPDTYFGRTNAEMVDNFRAASRICDEAESGKE